MIRTSLLLASASVLLACQGPAPEVTLNTTGGHIVDSRAWAVGSRIGIAASWDGPQMGTIAFTTPNGDSLLQEDVRWADRGFEGTPIGAGYASRAGIISQETAFDVRVLALDGRELSSTTIQTEQVSSIALGVALDDCPEFADIVIPDDAVFLEDTELMVYPAPLDADGNHLLGGLDFELTGDGPSLDDWGWGGETGVSWPTNMILGEGGTIAITIDGETHGFAVRTVTAEQIVSVGIDAQNEKHGFEDESLLTVFGQTANGERVYGVSATWSGASSAWNRPESTWAHAQAGELVDACIGELCATWGE